MWKVMLILTVMWGELDINFISRYDTPYASLDACREAVDGGDEVLEKWISGQVDRMLKDNPDFDISINCSEDD